MRLKLVSRGGAGVLAASLLAAACGGAPQVTRVVDGRVVEGHFVEPDAYAFFLRGAMAEERADLAEAAVAYDEAARRDDQDPEIWTRIAAVRCARSPGDPEVEAALSHALSIDAEYSPALVTRARCMLARDRTGGAASVARRAAEADPGAVDPELLLAHAEDLAGQAASSRNRLVALTLLEGSRVPAWDALASWARAHGDAGLAARALAEVALLSPVRRAELGAVAVQMAGEGELAAARSLAAAILDAPGDRSSGGLGPAAAASPLLARLAIDEAVLRRDADRARQRAVRAHLGLDVVAGRALLYGDARLARELVEPVVRADPAAPGARMVLAAAGEELSEPSTVAQALSRTASLREPVAPEVWLPFARLLSRTATSEVAHRVALELPHAPLMLGDALEGPPAVQLAVSGVLREEDLPADARIELAARRVAPPPLDALGSVDPRHRLFALALARPLDASVLELARRMAPAATHDPLIAVAFVRLSLARSGTPGDAHTLERVLALNPADPIVAAAALDLAKRGGDERAIAPARARLTALARTPAERAHALE